jgi:hypothetical protein
MGGRAVRTRADDAARQPDSPTARQPGRRACNSGQGAARERGALWGFSPRPFPERLLELFASALPPHLVLDARALQRVALEAKDVDLVVDA